MTTQKEIREQIVDFESCDSYRAAANLCERAGLPREARKRWAQIARANECSVNCDSIGTDTAYNVAQDYERVGKMLHAVKFYLLSGHGLSKSWCEERNLTPRMINYAKKSAVNHIQSHLEHETFYETRLFPRYLRESVEADARRRLAKQRENLLEE